MTSNIKYGLAQINSTVGNIKANEEKILNYILEAANKDIDVLIFPELSLCGYPPEDLLYSNKFINDCENSLNNISKNVPDNLLVILGTPAMHNGKLQNQAVLINNYQIVARYAKQHLPNYGVFDEKRYFTPGNELLNYSFKGTNLGITICEDIWQENGPQIALAKNNADIIINLSASPYHLKKNKERQELLQKINKQTGLPLIYCNLIGGQDEVVFDGGSMIMDCDGNILSQGAHCKEDFIINDLSRKDNINELQEEQEIWQVLKLGLKDYVSKNSFESIVLGLSGGIDSAVVAAVAIDALGPEKVNVVVMPSSYSSDDTQNDARRMAKRNNLNIIELPIEGVRGAITNELSIVFENTADDVTEENIQARIRGLFLMALSNKFNWLLLTTGNKSEMAVGYATLYGDMAGGFALLKDVPKTMVFKIAEWRNKQSLLLSKWGTENACIIPPDIITRPPSAELAADQKDTDNLPSYEILDAILYDFLEEGKDYDELIKKYPAPTVRRVIKLVNLAEYKRRQAPPGIKITTKAFGRDRRMPITHTFKF